MSDRVADVIASQMQELSDDEFWGELTIVYRAGKPTLIKKNETIRLDGGTANDSTKSSS